MKVFKSSCLTCQPETVEGRYLKIDSAFAKQLSGKERSRTKADELTSNRDTNITKSVPGLIN